MRYPVLRPPYVYRWAVLLTSLATAVTLAVVGVRAIGADAHPAGPVTPVASSSAAPTSTATAVPPDVVSHTAEAGRVVALTFDDGPHTEYTPQVLELLARYGAVATFCIVGVAAQRHPELVRAVAAAGMGLCSHTMSHDENLPAKTDGQMQAEVVGCQRAILDAAASGGATAGAGGATAGTGGATAAAVRWFRAPAGSWSQRLQGVAAANGMRPLGWSVDSRDWTRPGAAQIVATVQRDVRPGSVILLHDGGGRRDQTIAALGELLPWLVAQGYRFVLPS